MEPRVVRLTDDASRADDWHLCLLAEGIPHQMESVDGKLAFVVLEQDLARASELLDEWEEERRERAVERAAPAPADAPTLLGVVAAGGLVAFFAATLPVRERFVEAGQGSASAILHGEPWRALTALTLHADYIHVAGNAVAALIFFTALGRWIGGGVAALLIVVAGGLANLADAAVHGAGFSAIGASTATFAGVGLLAALQLRRRRQAAPRAGYWLPVAAALGLFAMLGTSGKQTDVLAHLLGLICGFLAGLPVGLRRAPRWAQFISGASALSMLTGAWLLALR